MTLSMLLSLLIAGWAAASCFAAEHTPLGVGPDKGGEVPASPQVGDNGQAPAPRYGLSEYRIGPEDLLNVSVWNNAAISRTVPVRPDGKISLPLVNDVHAAGLTPNQLRMVLMKRLAEFVPSPEVSVIVEEVHSFKVSVIGEVKKPGRHELKGSATVLDVLALGEGFGDFASRGRIVVLRPEGKTMRQIPFNYNKVVSSDGSLENFLLQPGDIIVVP
jgi:polysaccharide export outer membrane protein